MLRFIGVLYKDKKLNLITEYVAGGTLASFLHDSTKPLLPLTWSERIRFASDIARGMDYLHSRSIIHRDLNSQNCLVRNPERTVVVADFGLARLCRHNPNDGNGTVRKNTKERRKRYTGELKTIQNKSMIKKNIFSCWLTFLDGTGNAARIQI